ASPKHADFATEAIEPELTVVIEEVCRVLSLIHLCEIVFAQPEFVKRDSASVEIAEDTRSVLVVHFEVDTPIAPHAAQFYPASITDLVAVQPVDREIDVGEISSRAGDRQSIPYVSLRDFEVSQILLGTGRLCL